MKKIVGICFTMIISIFSLNAQIEVNTSGNVGIGVVPNTTDKLYVKDGYTTFKVNESGVIINPNSSTVDMIIGSMSGSQEPSIYPEYDYYGYVGLPNKAFWYIYGYYIYANGVQVTSDERLKQNITAIESPLEKIKNIRGVKYDLIDSLDSNISESRRNEIIEKGKGRIGFLAQELEEVYPEVVDYDELNDKYSIKYLEMIPILLEAIKEQQSIIENLQFDISILKASNLKSLSLTGDDNQIAEQNILYQNSPNPFSSNTIIKYNLPEASSNASIMICDMNGKQLKTVKLVDRGESRMNISSGELQPGMFLYTMIVDGRLIDTKVMVITE